MRRLGNYSIRILRHVAMRLKERRRQKKQQEGAKRNEIIGVWRIKLGVWEWQHAERPLNRWSAHSGTQKGGWNREPNVLRMVPGRVSFWRPRPPKKGSSFRPPHFGPPVKKTNRGRKMTPFWGARKRPRFWNRKTRKVGPRSHKKQPP